MQEKHGNLSEDGPNDCPHCNQTIVGFNQLCVHIENKHRKSEVKCKDCDMVFKNSKARYNHWVKECDLFSFKTFRCLITIGNNKLKIIIIY